MQLVYMAIAKQNLPIGAFIVGKVCRAPDYRQDLVLARVLGSVAVTTAACW